MDNYGGNPASGVARTMIACGVLTGIGSSRMHAREGLKPLFRVLWAPSGSVVGISISVLAFHRQSQRNVHCERFLAAFFALMGFANFASGLVLHCVLQQGLGVLWWQCSGGYAGSRKIRGWTFVGHGCSGEYCSACT